MNDIHVHQVLALIEKRNRVIDITTIDFELVADCTKTIEQAIAEGKYNIANYEINTKNFPLTQNWLKKR